MKPSPRSKQAVRLVWLIAGLIVVVFAVQQLSRSYAIHAHSIIYDNSGAKLVVQCDVVNPTSKSADLIATLRMTSGHQAKSSNPISLKPISQAVEIAAGEAKTLRFQTDLNVNPSALRAQVIIHDIRDN